MKHIETYEKFNLDELNFKKYLVYKSENDVAVHAYVMEVVKFRPRYSKIHKENILWVMIKSCFLDGVLFLDPEKFQDIYHINISDDWLSHIIYQTDDFNSAIELLESISNVEKYNL